MPEDRMARLSAELVDGCEVAILEDDDALREDILVAGLTELGFRVRGFARPAKLYRALLTHRFDLIVLDLGLPEEGGLSIAQHLREHSPIAIVVLTGHTDTRERVRGLAELVDAWLVKPVETEVLAATMISVLRRQQMAAATARASRRWHLIDDGWRLLSPSAEKLDLSANERAFLQCLFAGNGEVVPRQRLVSALAGGDPLFDPHRLEALAYRLRRKAQDAFGEPLPLRSVRGQGYVLLVASES